MSNDLQRVRFGDYEADLRTGSLRNRGTPIRLQHQPFRILELLVRSAGELVTREQIRDALWPADTHVGFEIGLNRAVNRLRSALNDTASAPRFIETIAGRGYRFVAPVEEIRTSATRSRERLAVGVLPFRNLTGDDSLDYLCDGLTEDVNFELARASGLRVTAPSTMFRSREESAESVARALKLNAVLRGEMLKRGDQFSVRVEILDGSGMMLWGTRIETSLETVQTLKTQIAKDTWRVLEVEAPQEKTTKPASPEAYRAYLQGRFHWNRRTPAEMREGILSFENAIAIDPEYALAYSGLADAYALLAVSPYCAVPPKQTMPRARAAAERAIQLDPKLAEGHTSLAMVQFNYDWDFAASEVSFRRAIELNASYAAAHQWYSLLLIAQARYDEARGKAVLARDLDPMSATANALVGVSLYFGREPQKAQDELKSLIEVEPKSSLAWSFLGMSSIGLKQFDRAEMAFQKALEISPENTTAWAGLGNVWARKGERERVKAIFERIELLEQERYIPPQVRVFLYVGLGEVEQAIDWLEKAYEQRCDFLVYIAVDPALDPLRGTARFEELRRKIGFSTAR